MIPALLETIGALSLLASIAAKIVLLHGLRDEDVQKRSSVRHVRTASFRLNERGEAHRARPALSARCARLAAGRAVLSRIRRPG
ncbi:hypothetical protein AWB76_01072 [Caballeronia temeraria]|uniref:Uncharacterized protein n=1 Tax=Caballeronia temeraria TaxID=1777137 RepID=A0A157ZQD8_9BURK|nr:hypothetical protein AWB76_01072 [Caballeronia temeraria]